MKKQIIALTLVGSIVFSPIFTPVYAGQKYIKASFVNIGLYDTTEEHAKELVKDIDPMDLNALIAAGYMEKSIQSEDELEIGDLCVVTNAAGEQKKYIYISSTTALLLKGVNTSESVNYHYTADNTKIYSYQKKMPLYQVPQNLTCGYGTNIDSVTLPTGFMWQSTDKILKMGENTFQVKYVPENTLMYLTIENIDVKVDCIKNKITKLTIPQLEPIEFNSQKTLADVPLPDGWTWDNPDTVPSLGTISYPASYNPQPAENYDLSALPTNKASIPLVVKGQDIKDYNVTIGKGWDLYDIPLPQSTNGTYTYKNANQTYKDTGLYTATLSYLPYNGTAVDVKMNITVTNDLKEYKIPQKLSTTYGKKLSSVSLPDGWTWSNPDSVISHAGTISADAVFSDGKNTINKSLKLDAAKAKAPSIKKPKDMEVDWDKNLKLSNIALPDGWSWDNSKLKMGTNKYKVSYKVSAADLLNYDYKKEDYTAEIYLRVKKIIPEYHIPSEISAKKGEKLNDSLLPEAENGKYKWSKDYIVEKAGIFQCMFIPKDEEHYKTIEGIDVKVVIKEEKVTVPDTVSTKQISTIKTDTKSENITISKKPEIKKVKNISTKKVDPTIKKIKDVKVKAPLKTIFARDIKIADNGKIKNKTVHVEKETSDLKIVTHPAEGKVQERKLENSSNPTTAKVTTNSKKEVTTKKLAIKNNQKPSNKIMLVIGSLLVFIGIGAGIVFLRRKKSQNYNG